MRSVRALYGSRQLFLISAEERFLIVEENRSTFPSDSGRINRRRWDHDRIADGTTLRRWDHTSPMGPHFADGIADGIAWCPFFGEGRPAAAAASTVPGPPRSRASLIT